MRKVLVALASALSIAGLLALTLVGVRSLRGAQASGLSCTPTGFYRDGINLTAAVINPATTVRGTVDATGCNIGVYFGPGTTGDVKGAEIFRATYFGVVNNGGNVTVRGANIHDIGESPLNGDQHGVGVYFAFNSGASGTITGNHVWRYQKGGIVVTGETCSATISENIVNGQGPVDYIAQNGIEVGLGATGLVMRNTVTGNSYTGTSTVSGGIIVFGGPGYQGYFSGYDGAYSVGVQIVGNTVIGNDVGIWLTQVDANFNPPATATNIKVINNTVSDDAVTNNYSGFGYQAGIADQGNNDKLIANTITGAGYTPSTSATAYLIGIDASTAFTNRPKVHANQVPM